jgi:CHAT domain-containing protein
MARKWFHRPLILLVLLATTLAGARKTDEEAAFETAALLCDRGDWGAALPYIDVSLQRFRGSDADAVWGLRVLRGKALIGRNDAVSAIAALQSELPLRLARSDTAVYRLTYLATAHYREKHFPIAEELLIRAEKLARAYQPRTISEVLLFRANFEYARKQRDEAIRYGRAAIAAARRYAQPSIEIKALSTVAIVRTEQQHYDEAIDLFIRQLDLARASGSESTIIKIEGNLAWAYESIGDFETASVLLSHAIPVATKLRADHDLIVFFELFGDIAHMRGDKAAALDYYKRGLSIARRAQHRDLADFISNLATAELEAGDLAAASRTNEESSTMARGEHDQKQILRALLIEARIDAASDHLGSAVEKAQRVIDSADSKPLQWEAEARLAQFHAGAKRNSEADEHFRRAIDTAAEARKEVKSDEFRLPFGALVREIYDDYVSFLLARNRVAEALAVAETSRAQTLAEALDAGAAPQRVDPIRLARERHAIILSYWLSPNRSFVWIITSSSIEVAKVEAGKLIEQKVDLYSKEILSLRSNEGSRAHGAELFNMLVKPVAKRIPKGTHVIIVPDGRMHAFNMETLVNPATGKYWIEDVTIETTGSLELLDRVRADASPSSMLLVGDPPSPAAEFSSLSKATEEMDFVRKHFMQACTTLNGRGATPRAYGNANPGAYGYIHFVAHGIATRMRPLDSAVILARDGDSYKLYARDIIKQKLHARLVTISSCHGAGTRAYTGEGLVGLAWAFLHAGAQQVIAALWEVNDNATPKLMDDLYTGIRAGQDPATALRNAKLNLLHSRSVFRHPKYWAPFVLYSGS